MTVTTPLEISDAVGLIRAEWKAVTDTFISAVSQMGRRHSWSTPTPLQVSPGSCLGCVRINSWLSYQSGGGMTEQTPREHKQVCRMCWWVKCQQRNLFCSLTFTLVAANHMKSRGNVVKLKCKAALLIQIYIFLTLLWVVTKYIYSSTVPLTFQSLYLSTVSLYFYSILHVLLHYFTIIWQLTKHLINFLNMMLLYTELPDRI